MKDLDTLIQKAQNRDTSAFDHLYTRTSREIGWYCKRLCGNEFDTQDLMQEVYLTAWIKLPQYAGVNFPAWLRSIAHNSFLNRLKNTDWSSLQKKYRTVNRKMSFSVLSISQNSVRCAA